MTEPARKGCKGFSLLEVLISAAVLMLILVATMSLLNMTRSSYRNTSGRLDSFETARVAFDTLTRSIAQATLLANLGYDDPTVPAEYVLKSDLHFICGSRQDLGLDAAGAPDSHAIFFQAPLGIADSSDLKSARRLLNATGFFIAYGSDPMLPVIAQGKVPDRNRYRLFQFLQPREEMAVYDHTIMRDGGIPESDDEYKGSDWFRDDVNNDRFCHPLAENVVALAILPVSEGMPASSYLWNSRDGSVAYSKHRLPQALKVMMAVIDEAGVARLGNPSAAPKLFPDGLFAAPEDFEKDLKRLETALSEFSPPLQYRIFASEIPLNASNTDL